MARLISVADCEIVFTSNLAGAFSSFSPLPVGKSGDQLTQEGFGQPTITHRQNRSQWSTDIESSSLEDPASFFFRLVFENIDNLEFIDNLLTNPNAETLGWKIPFS